MLVKRLKTGFGVALCKCGHLSCAHSSKLSPLDEGRSYRDYHQGGCCECSCKQFTFHKFVSLEEAAEILEEVHA